jgi:hypothetical protein
MSQPVHDDETLQDNVTQFPTAMMKHSNQNIPAVSEIKQSVSRKTNTAWFMVYSMKNSPSLCSS